MLGAHGPPAIDNDCAVTPLDSSSSPATSNLAFGPDKIERAHLLPVALLARLTHHHPSLRLLGSFRGRPAPRPESCSGK